MAEENKKRIVILGAGLAGAYAAILFGRKGYEVDVYERRPDTRGKGGYEGRSINLALSYRGRTALAKAGLEEEIVKNCVPMKGRLMHDTDGKRSYMQYGQDDQAILSVSRQLLNEKLIDKAEENPNVRFHFQVSCKAVNPSNRAESLVMVDEREDGEEHFVGEEESFAKRGKTFSRGADLVIGADGIYSNVRKALQRIKGINFSQMYLDHGYKELVIPPAANGDYAMTPHNALHIWPRGDFMMIALPNPDKSYTVTLFMPWVKFNAIKNVEDVRQFFQATFPDSIPLMPTLEHDFFANPTCHLCTVRLNPWHHKEFVVVGDAAHAVVPFFGQGMNASLEDVTILDELVTKYEGNFDLALEEFSATRPKDANAVSDLSLRNYIEMRSEVAHSTFLRRARLERWIERYPRLSEWVLRLPWKKGDSNDPTGGFHPKYSMVSFSDIPYTELIRRNEIQTKRLDFLLYRVLPFSVVVGGAIAVPGVRRFILQVVDNIASGFKNCEKA